MLSEFKHNNVFGWYVEKDPSSVLDFAIDWTDWLAAFDDQILASVWTVLPGIVQTNDEISGPFTVIWLGAATAGAILLITNRITTVGNGINQRIEEQSFTVVVRDH